VITYLIRRLVHSLFVLIGVSAIVFVLIRLTGDPALLLLPPDATVEQIRAFRQQMGFDKPVYLQYVDFLGRAVQGDFGMSFRNRQPALGLVLERLPATLELTLVGLVVALLVSIPSGILSAVRKDSMVDAVSRVVALFGQCIPSFWLAIMLILVFSVSLRWFPAYGRGGPEYLVLPGLTLGLYSAAITSRLLRSSMLEVLSSDYVRTAYAKGLRERAVLYHHALKNAAIPVVTVIGLQVGTLLGGAVITEYVFAYPGMGRLVLQAIAYRDFSVVQAFVLVIASLIAAINIAMDLLYAWLDPRVRIR